MDEFPVGYIHKLWCFWGQIFGNKISLFYFWVEIGKLFQIELEIECRKLRREKWWM
jgi:hypothetical protein